MSKPYTTRRLLSFGAVLLAAIPLAAQAQERDLDREPSIGKVVEGETGPGGTARFLLTLAPGQALDVTAAPVAGADPFLRVFDANTDALIAENDDAAGSLASNVRLYSAAGQRVRLEVSNAVSEGEGGDASIGFSLIVRPTDWRPKPVVPLALGETHRGELARGDEQLFRFRGERGQMWELSLVQAAGSSLDPALQVFAGEVAGGTALAQDDDGGGGVNARVRFLVPDTGTYTVRAYPVGPSEGDYTFIAGRPAPATVAEIEFDRPATGTLEAGASEHLYRLSARARRAAAAASGPLVVELRRTSEGEGALDPILDVGFETPLGFTTLLTDDDGGGDTNARVVFDAGELPAQWLEALRIKARAFQQTEGGYELVVSEGSGD
jgi:hypothetical protein